MTQLATARSSWRFAAALLLAAAPRPAAAQAQDRPANPGFEEGTAGEVPVGWRSPTPGYTVEISAAARTGAYSGRIARGDPPRAGEFGNLMQTVDAAPYRGKRVRLRGWIRVQPASPASSAALWLRVDRVNRERGFFDNMSDRPAREAEWQEYEIIGDVAPDASVLALGMLLSGHGSAWLDDVTLEVLGDTPEPVREAPRPLGERATENLVAFARLLGYVRYFHPSDEAAGADWEQLAIEGVRAVEGAPDASALASALTHLFRPVAPTLLVHAAADRPRAPAAVSGGEVVTWRHRGVGSGQQQGVYRSTRIRARAAALPDSFPDPRAPLEIDLVDGVRVRLPLAVFADSAGTLPRAVQAPPAMPAPTRGGHSAEDRATRLAAVILAWNVFQHFYPYFDIVGTDWHAELPRALRAAADDPDPGEFHATLQRLVAALHDGHGYVGYTAGPPLRTLPLAWEWLEDRLVVTAVADTTTSVRPGDIVLRIDGAPAAERLADVESLTSAATPQWRRFRALRTLMAGPEGSTLTLVVLRADGTEHEVRVQRTAATSPAEARPEPVAEVAPGIMYVDIDRVTDAQFRDALPRLAEARGLIFDLRGYPRRVTAANLLSHLLTGPGTSAQWHIPVVMRPDREDMRFERGGEWDLRPRQPHLGAPRIFLTDGRAISYAESVMGIVEHYRLGEILGATTAGTNGNVNPFTLPGGYSVSWTGMKVLKHDGSQHHGVGIAPTIPLERTIAGVRAGRDELLQAAIERLQREGTR